MTSTIDGAMEKEKKGNIRRDMFHVKKVETDPEKEKRRNLPLLATEAIVLQQGNLIGKLVNAPDQYVMSFVLRPLGVINQKASIMKITSTIDDCCKTYGDQIPDIMFSPANTHKIFFAHDRLEHLNEHKGDIEGVKLNQDNLIKVVSDEMAVTLYVNGVEKAKFYSSLKERPTSTVAYVYAGSDYHPAANAEIRDFTYTPISVPTTSSSVPMNDATFRQAISLWFSDRATAAIKYGSIEDWNVRYVTDMSSVFHDKKEFNDNISRWDVSSTTDMKNMFFNAESFDQDISNWNVSAVTDMERMFQGTVQFNHSLNVWDVKNVENMFSMFSYTSSFNKELSSWSVGKVSNMRGMFYSASKFNQDLNRWDVGSVTNMSVMFVDASSFEQKVCWNVEGKNADNFLDGSKGTTDCGEEDSV